MNNQPLLSFFFTILTFLAIAFAPLKAKAIDVGSTAPELSLQALDSSQVALSKFRGKFIYLDFWASWCGPCKHSVPWMNTLVDRFGSRGLEIVAVNLDTEEKDVKKFLEGIKVNFLILRDPAGKTPESFEVASMPTSFLIDRSGKIVYVHPGFSESDEADIEKVIQEALAKEK